MHMNKLKNTLLFGVFALSFVQESEALALKKITGTLLSFNGRGTYYDVGPGSCGETDSNTDMVVAMNKEQMNNGVNPNNNPKCHKKIKIIGNSGKLVTARIVDTCPGCDNGSVDMSPTLFKKVCGDLSLGVCSINWDFS